MIKEGNKKIFFSNEILILSDGKWTEHFIVLHQNELIISKKKGFLNKIYIFQKKRKKESKKISGFITFQNANIIEKYYNVNDKIILITK